MSNQDRKVLMTEAIREARAIVDVGWPAPDGGDLSIPMEVRAMEQSMRAGLLMQVFGELIHGRPTGHNLCADCTKCDQCGGPLIVRLS